MSAGPLPAAAGELVRLRPLTLVDDGDDVLVGDPEAGTFVAVPPVGAVVIRALQRGATTGEAAADAERHAGEPVDVESFVDTLRELGFVDEGPQDAPAAAEELPVPRRTAPVQQRRWLRVPLRQQHARLLFTPAAWCCYAVAFAFCVACFALRPDLWPRAADVFVLGDNPLSVIAAVLLSYLLAAVHETWHWLAARSLGLAARFGVDRRLYFLVFETDLSQLWSVPRRRRYGPQLAGLAVDSVSLAALLAVEVLARATRLALPAALGRLLPMLVFLQVTSMLWQCEVLAHRGRVRPALPAAARGARHLAGRQAPPASRPKRLTATWPLVPVPRVEPPAQWLVLWPQVSR